MRLAAAALALLVASGAVAADVVYLHVEANEGGASGGHVALRVGDAVFHYQHEAPGVLALHRDAPERFEQRYRLLQNRTIHAAHVAVDDAAAERLADELTRRHLVGQRQRACRAALDEDVRLLSAMDGERVDLAIAGAGFFADGGDGEPALIALRDRVDRLALRVAAVRRRLEALRYDAVAPAPTPSADGAPPCWGFAQRYLDALAMLRALDVLAAARPLRRDAIRSADLPLRPDEPPVLAAHRDALADRLVRLVASDNPGAGFALLVGMARLVALTHTLAGGRWIVLDAYPTDAPSLEADRDVLDALIPRARRELDVARNALVARGADGGEAVLGDVEAAANRLAELHAARDDGRPLRIQSGPLLPSRAAGVDPLPTVPPGAAASLAEARARRDRYDAAYVALNRYELLTRNCVTELFAAADTAMRPSPHGPLDFIPFVAAASVADTWPVTSREERASYRRMRLAALSGAGARLRETNTLTTTIYRSNRDDSVFLFFTDDTIAPRPLFGAANLLVGLGAGVAGLATLPVDRGALLRAGLWGALWSLPELVFVNIRKGSFVLPQAETTSNTSTSAGVRATSDSSSSSTTAAPSPASSPAEPSCTEPRATCTHAPRPRARRCEARAPASSRAASIVASWWMTMLSSRPSGVTIGVSRPATSTCCWS